MPIPPGDYELLPEHATLTVFTGREGMAASVGHDLTLEVGHWTAAVHIDEDLAACTLAVTADLSTLEVVEGIGGAMPLTSDNIADIEKNARKALAADRYPALTFTSTSVTGTWDAATIHGELTLHGQTAPQDLTLNRVGRVGNDQWRVSGEVVQSRFGIKPFSAFLGALKVKDEVRFEVVAAFGEASGS